MSTSSSKVRKKLNYNKNDIKLALKEIQDGKLKIREASKKYNIPRGTLQDRLHGRSKSDDVRLGRMSVLSDKEEECMELWLIKLAKCGFPLKRADLQNTVQNIVREDQRPTPFVDQRPGRRWCEAFMKRHAVLNERTPEGISKARAVVTEEYVRKWFRDLEAFLTSINAADILDDPTRILNGDETSFSICPKSGKVIAPKGWRNCYEIKPGSEKETITVLLVFSAAGETVVPMVVFPYIRPPKEVVNSIPPDWFLGRSESGWMRSEIFFEYIANGVNNWLIEKEIKKPVLLLVDGHKSHLTMDLSEFCDSNGIILYALPANTTHMLQPADVSVFRPLKVEWRKTVREWQRKEENFNRSLTKSTFCPLLEQTLKKDMKQTIMNGFRKCGLYPFNPDAVDYTKCVKNAIENFDEDESSEVTKDEKDTTVKVLKHFNKSLIEVGIDINPIITIINGPLNNETENEKTEDSLFNAPNETENAPFAGIIEETSENRYVNIGSQKYGSTSKETKENEKTKDILKEIDASISGTKPITLIDEDNITENREINIHETSSTSKKTTYILLLDDSSNNNNLPDANANTKSTEIKDIIMNDVNLVSMDDVEIHDTQIILTENAENPEKLVDDRSNNHKLPDANVNTKSTEINDNIIMDDMNLVSMDDVEIHDTQIILTETENAKYPEKKGILTDHNYPTIKIQQGTEESENMIIDPEETLPHELEFPISDSCLENNLDMASDFSFSLLKSSPKQSSGSAASTPSNRSYQMRSKSNTPTNRTGISPCFRKHLYTPKSLSYSKKGNAKENLPSAISSQAWRDFMKEKEEAKQELENRKRERKDRLKILKEVKAKKKEELAKKRSIAALQRTKLKKTKKLVKSQPEATQSRIKCVGCEEDLISDVEDDDLKNIGCDKCPRWFHLKCTVHRGRPYVEVAEQEFICHVCYI